MNIFFSIIYLIFFIQLSRICKAYFRNFLNPGFFISLQLLILSITTFFYFDKISILTQVLLTTSTFLAILFSIYIWNISKTKYLLDKYSHKGKLKIDNFLFFKSKKTITLFLITFGLGASFLSLFYINSNFGIENFFNFFETVSRLKAIRYQMSLGFRPQFHTYFYLSETFILVALIYFYGYGKSRELKGSKKRLTFRTPQFILMSLIFFNSQALFFSSSKATFSRPYFIFLIIFIVSKSNFILKKRPNLDTNFSRLKISSLKNFFFVSFIMSLIIFLIFNYAMRISADGDFYDILINAFHRYTFPILYLNQVIENNLNNHSFLMPFAGAGSFLPLVKLISLSFFNNSFGSLHIAPFININIESGSFLWNTGTYLEYSIRDMGFLGLFIYPFIISFTSTKLYIFSLHSILKLNSIFAIVLLGFSLYIPYTCLAIYPLARPLMYFQIFFILMVIIIESRKSKNLIKI